jgi:arylsulfatase A-like enzyme
MLHFLEPHLPYEPPEPFRGRFTGDDSSRSLPEAREVLAAGDAAAAEERAFFVGRYDEEIAFLDSELGRLFEGLGERWDDSVVVLVSDHGEEFLEHGGFQHGHSVREELLRIPWLMWSPGLAPRRIEESVSLVDVAPTVLEALGLSPELLGTKLSGQSLWRRAVGGGPIGRRPIFAEQLLFGRERKAVVDWPYKLILDPGTGRRKLLDLSKDPLGRSDLAIDHPELADRLEEELRRRVPEGIPRRAREDSEPMSHETRRELEALGYLN